MYNTFDTTIVIERRAFGTKVITLRRYPTMVVEKYCVQINSVASLKCQVSQALCQMSCTPVVQPKCVRGVRLFAVKVRLGQQEKIPYQLQYHCHICFAD